MRVDKTEWPHEPFGSLPPEDTNVFCAEVQEAPPGFGFDLYWTIPRKWWRPTLAINIWDRRLQIGWLYE